MDLSDVELINCDQAAVWMEKVLGLKRRPETVWYWTKYGLKRGAQPMKLRFKMRGRDIYTTRAWLRAFIEETNRSSYGQH